MNKKEYGVWKINYTYPLEGFVYMWNAIPMHQPVEYDPIEVALATSDFKEANEVIDRVRKSV